jgi:hypothetical protein
MREKMQPKSNKQIVSMKLLVSFQLHSYPRGVNTNQGEVKEEGKEIRCGDHSFYAIRFNPGLKSLGFSSLR